MTPHRDAADAQTQRDGWTASSSTRSFRLQHWEYDADRLDGNDYDIDAVLLRSASPADEAELTTTIYAWQPQPGQFTYPWNTHDPK